MDLADEIIGYIASVLTIISLLPQLIKIIINKSANDVALSTYFIFVIVEVLWLYYGIKIVNYQIIIANGTCCIMSISVIVLGYIYKKKETIDTTDVQMMPLPTPSICGKVPLTEIRCVS